MKDEMRSPFSMDAGGGWEGSSKMEGFRQLCLKTGETHFFLQRSLEILG
jgi:hypothetical protein